MCTNVALIWKRLLTLSCCLLYGHTVAVQALVGHQYGAASLPTRVEVSEYQLLLREGQKAGICTQEVERMYQRDENSIPTSYCLTTLPRRTSGFQVRYISFKVPVHNTVMSRHFAHSERAGAKLHTESAIDMWRQW